MLTSRQLLWGIAAFMQQHRVPGRTAPDTVTAIVDYKEGFTTCFTTHFGNGANNYDRIFGSKGTMRILDPDGNIDGVKPTVSSDGSEAPDKVPDGIVLEEIPQDDHMMNWVKCMRSREQPHAHAEWGYKHGVAVILADRACVEGRKMRFDPEQRKILPA